MSIEDMAVLCVKNGVVKKLVQEFCDHKVIEIEEAKERLGREHWEILAAFKEIAKTGCAKYTIGRRNQKTRINWTQDIKEIITRKTEHTELVKNENTSDVSLDNASLEQLISAIKSRFNASSVNLAY